MRSAARPRRGAQRGEQALGLFGRIAMLLRKLGIRLDDGARRPVRAQLLLHAQAECRLRDQTTKNDPSRRVNPVRRERIDDLAPESLLTVVKICGRLGASCSRELGDDSERGGGFAGHGFRIRQHEDAVNHISWTTTPFPTGFRSARCARGTPLTDGARSPSGNSATSHYVGYARTAAWSGRRPSPITSSRTAATSTSSGSANCKACASTATTP